MVILSFADFKGQAPVVQRTDNFIHREKAIQWIKCTSTNTFYLMASESSGG